MSDEPVSAAPVVKVAQDLSAIVDLSSRLLTEAVHSANDREILGGEAMVALGPVADPSQYAENVEAAEWRHEANPRRWPDATLDLGHEDDDLAPVTQVLWFWTDALRDRLGFPLEGRRPTPATEANVLRQTLDWLWDNEPHFDDLAADVRGARRRLENILHDGERATVTRVVCPDCDAGRQLIARFGDTPSEDRWKCPACRHTFYAEELPDAWAKQMRSQGAQRWVPVNDVVSVMESQGWQPRTVRSWFERMLVEVRCDLESRRCAAWWPDVWRTHLAERHRREQAARKAADLKARKEACRREHGEDCWVKARGCSKRLAEAS